jgi:hypothetical protein
MSGFAGQFQDETAGRVRMSAPFSAFIGKFPAKIRFLEYSASKFHLPDGKIAKGM